MPVIQNAPLRPLGRRLGGPPPRIGFVVDWLEDTYQTAILGGAASVARERGASLVALPGGVLGAQHAHGECRNSLFRLISPQYYDALVVMTGTLGNAQGGDIRELICKEFPARKICSVAIDLPGSSSVLIDNAQGMRKAVEHLVLVHGYEKIGFIRGPVTNAEAEARYQAYRDVLEAHGRTIREELVLQGDFRKEAGTQAIVTLLDERKIPVRDIDALVAADDSMALAALVELGRRGISVPFEIAIVGFDDVEEARYSSPPLSSVKQPLHEQGRQAMKAALNSLSAESLPTGDVLETSCSWRRSCGCVPDDTGTLSERPASSMRLSLEASLIKRRELLLAEMTRAARGSFVGLGRGWEVKIFNALQDEFKGHAGTFRAAYDRLLEQALRSGSEVSSGNAIISALRKQLTVCAGEDLKQLRQVESLLHDARILTSDVVERSEAQKRIRAQNWSRDISEVSAKLLATFDLTKLNRALREQLPRLGISSCLLARYSIARPGHALLVGYFDKNRTQDERLGAEFVAAELAPAGLVPVDDAVQLIVEPLVHEQEAIGFVVFKHGEAEGYVYEVLCQVLGSALLGAELRGLAP